MRRGGVMPGLKGFKRDGFYSELIRHINECLEDQTGGGVRKALLWVQDLADCGDIVLCRIKADDAVHLKSIVNISYCNKWVDLYERSEFFRKDPVVTHAAKGQGLFCWSEAFEKMEETVCKDFVDSARDHGYVSGFAMSMLTPDDIVKGFDVTLVSLASKNAELNSYAEEAWRGVMPVIHHQARFDDTDQICPLSARELEVLKWISTGKTIWETSVILGLAEATIKYHMKSIFKKLGVYNRAQAVAKAVRSRWL